MLQIPSSCLAGAAARPLQFVLLLSLLAAPALADAPPASDIHVFDNAQQLSATETTAIETRFRAYEQKRHLQVLLFTTEHSGGRDALDQEADAAIVALEASRGAAERLVLMINFASRFQPRPQDASIDAVLFLTIGPPGRYRERAGGLRGVEEYWLKDRFDDHAFGADQLVLGATDAAMQLLDGGQVPETPKMLQAEAAAEVAGNERLELPDPNFLAALLFLLTIVLAGVFILRAYRPGNKRRHHQSRWRAALACAAPVGAAVLVCSLFADSQGPEMLLSPKPYWFLGPLSLAGCLVAWQVARAMSRRVSPVAFAQGGDVALRGKAQPLPNRSQLTSPRGTPCLWYDYDKSFSDANRHVYHSGSDSVEPFLLVDASGSCIVLPDGAEVDGGHKGPRSRDEEERLILPGDTIYVVGSFKPASDETLQLQRQIEAPPKPALRVTLDDSDLKDLDLDTADGRRKALDRGELLLHQAEAKQAAEAAPLAPGPLLLPVVCAPRLGPYYIIAREGQDEAGLYRGLLWINLALLLLSAAMALLLSAGAD